MRSVRIAVAAATLAAALGYVAVGWWRPEWVGLGGRPVLLYMTGPALVIAAVLQLVLVINRRW